MLLEKQDLVMRKQLHFMGWMFSFIPLSALDEKR
ncbi:hypothetical protein protein [Bacillus cereus G9241]|nr:hypothetical protein protein [Bacillus cereus G9241]